MGDVPFGIGAAGWGLGGGNWGMEIGGYGLGDWALGLGGKIYANDFFEDLLKATGATRENMLKICKKIPLLNGGKFNDIFGRDGLFLEARYRGHRRKFRSAGGF